MALPGSRRWRLFLAAAARGCARDHRIRRREHGAGAGVPARDRRGRRPVARRGSRRRSRHRRAGGRGTPTRTARSSRSTPSAYTLLGEASGRRAVKLAPGQYVASRSRSANALTIRYMRSRTPRPAAASTVAVDGRRRSQRRRPREHASADNHADVEVLVPLQPLIRSRTTRRPACCTRTGGSPNASAFPLRPPRRRRSHPVQADALLRRAARAADRTTSREPSCA